MLLGRFLPIVAVLALAGLLARQPRVAPSAGTLSTGTPLFSVLVAGTVVLVAAITFLPALALSPSRRDWHDRRPRTSTHLRPARRRGRVRPRCSWSRCRRAAQARPARPGAQPGDVRGVGRSVVVTVAAVLDPSVFAWWIAVWLWFTVVFADLAEAVAEGRGRAQADALRATRTDTVAHTPDGREVPATDLRIGDHVVVEAGQTIPGDGEIVEGIATVDESAITGESAPVVRESGGDLSSVTGGTTVLSDRIVVRITARPGESFVDRMIALVEGARAPEDAERDRADDPARGADHRVPARRRGPAADGRLLRGRAVAGRAGGAAGLPHPDDHRRAALGDRHRRDGPARAAQRAGDLGSRGRGRRRRVDAAARQDRDDHLRQPPGDGAAPACPGSTSPSSPRWPGWRASPTPRRRGARSSPCARRSTGCPRRRAHTRRSRSSSVQCDDPHVGRGPRRPRAPQGRDVLGARVAGRGGVDAERAELEHLSREIAERGGTPLVVASHVRTFRPMRRKFSRRGAPGSSSCRTS